MAHRNQRDDTSPLLHSALRLALGTVVVVRRLKPANEFSSPSKVLFHVAFVSFSIHRRFFCCYCSNLFPTSIPSVVCSSLSLWRFILPESFFFVVAVGLWDGFVLFVSAPRGSKSTQFELKLIEFAKLHQFGLVGSDCSGGNYRSRIKTMLIIKLNICLNWKSLVPKTVACERMYLKYGEISFI